MISPVVAERLSPELSGELAQVRDHRLALDTARTLPCSVACWHEIDGHYLISSGNCQQIFTCPAR